MTDAEQFPGDPNGQAVSNWSTEIHNLGFSAFEDKIARMLESGVWQEFTDATGHWKFLPGEFDYFLSSVNVDREHVMHGVRDIKVKALLQEAMDQRRTDEGGYRRAFEEVREANPAPPLGTLQPFGYKLRERSSLEEAGIPVSAKQRDPLGSAVRQYIKSGQTSMPKPYTSPLDQMKRRGLRLSDEDLAELIDHLATEQERRKSSTSEASGTEPDSETDK